MAARALQRTIKRLIDVGAAASGLVALAPVMAATAAAVRVSLGAPVLFRQRRPGLGGAPFELIKFRTMRAAAPGEGVDSDARRLTAVGAKLRAWSLDELPTLWNVLRGDMSLVGPRPLLMQYLDRYTPEQARRHEVRPGVTGWAQVNGRNALSWDDKFALDVWYVDNWSLWLDARILLRTFTKVLRRDGISAEQHATMPEFLGGDGGRAPSLRIVG
jgi:lipopolysaccharide/colanic/teichoic acid biosynthesis glycosyltransferase